MFQNGSHPRWCDEVSIGRLATKVRRRIVSVFSSPLMGSYQWHLGETDVTTPPGQESLKVVHRWCITWDLGPD